MHAALAAALLAVAQPAWGHGYQVATQWPSGIFERQLRMLAKDMPLCRAVAKALNASPLPKPLAMCRGAPLASDGVVEAVWRPVQADDPFALYMRFEKTLVPKALFDDADIADAKARLGDGRTRFETTTVPGLAPLTGDVRLLRLVTADCSSSASSDDMDTVVADGTGFESLRKIGGVGSFGSVFAFRGRAYLVEMEREAFGDATAKRLTAPRPVVGVAETFAYDGDIAAAKVCHIRYR